VGYGGDTSIAELKSGTLVFGLTSKGQDGTGLADVGLEAQNVDVTATVYRLASGSLS
jgi:hypothetical protein